MKYIKYNMQISGDLEAVKLTAVRMSYSESHLEIAKKEAYNGEYTIEDDGTPEPVVEPTIDEIVNALLGVTA